jgi:hypothetical protein
MSYKDKYLNIMYGDGIRDIRINNTKRLIYSTFKDDPAYYQVLIANATTEAAIPIDVHINDKSDVRDEKWITTYYDNPLEYGSYIYWKKSWWLNIHLDEMSEIYRRGIISKCYSSIKWMDENRDIKEAFFAFRINTPSNFGLEDGRIVEIGNERRHIIMQKNADTTKIVKSQRFIVDERAWKVISIDRLTEGLIYLVLEESEINPATDNLELRIADYHPNIYSVEIRNDDNLSINVNQTLQLDIVAYKNDIPVSIDEINLSSSNPAVGTIDKQGMFIPLSEGQTTIVAEYMGLSDSVVIFVRKINVNNYTVDIIGPDFIYSGQKQLYQAVFKNNGMLINESAKFSLFADDGISQTKLVTIDSISGNSITLKADTKLLGTFVLKVKSDNQLISGEKIIRVKSLI